MLLKPPAPYPPLPKGGITVAQAAECMAPFLRPPSHYARLIRRDDARRRASLGLIEDALRAGSARIQAALELSAASRRER